MNFYTVLTGAKNKVIDFEYIILTLKKIVCKIHFIIKIDIVHN